MKTVFVLVDALKSSYLTKENMPNLYSLSEKSRVSYKVFPSPGFCERSEVFTGLSSYDTGNFTALGYEPQYSPYRCAKVELFLFKIAAGLSYKVARYALNKYRIFRKIRMNPYRIPIRDLNLFFLTEDGERRITSYRNIFDVMDERGLKYSLDKMTSLADLSPRDRESNLEFLKREILNDDYFIPIYIGDVDTAGHTYGDDIASIRSVLQRIDLEIKNLYTYALEHGYAFVLLGDHGMVPVKQRIDIKEKFREYGFQLDSKNVKLFIDSTCVRFWIKDDETREVVRNILIDKLSDYGEVVDCNNCEEKGIPLDVQTIYGNSVYGDLLWCVYPGVLLHPDFFHSVKTRTEGMHGYLKTDVKHGTGVYIANRLNSNKEEIEDINLKDVCGEICSLLEIPLPNASDWRRKIIWK